VEPHHELAGAFVVDDFGALQNTATGDIVDWRIANRKNDPFILPVVQVGGGVTGDPDLRFVALGSGDLELNEPVVGALMKEQPAAMGIERQTTRIIPDLSGLKCRCRWSGFSDGRLNLHNVVHVLLDYQRDYQPAGFYGLIVSSRRA
jgi:hypothetical protein